MGLRSGDSPRYELSRVLTGERGTESSQVVRVILEDGRQLSDRRRFFGESLAASVALVGLSASGCATKNMKVRYRDDMGVWQYKTMPCGEPLPSGAICTCNCVPAQSASTTTTYCSCNQVCTCVPVAY